MYRDRKKYHTKRKGQPYYAVLAGAIKRVSGPSPSVLDVGCSCGELLRHMRHPFKMGIDVSAVAKITFDVKSAYFELYDLETDNRAVGFFGVIVCMEVPEHIENWSNLLDVVSANADPTGCTLFWSAAPPGQRGQGHVNLKPPRWWRRKLAERGWNLDRRKTRRFKRLVEGQVPSHYSENMRVYCR